MADGKAVKVTKAVLLERVAASKNRAAEAISLRMNPADLQLARKQASERGLPYQTYIKSILHDELQRREKPGKAS